MSDTKTYVFGQDSNYCMNALLPLLQQKGVDPSILAMMNNGGFGGNNNFIWVFFLLILFGWGGNGAWGNNGKNGQLLNAINDSTGRDLLMQAINGNGNAIGQLSTKLNCDVNAIQGALNSISSQICSVGNQVGMTGQQVINAIQHGNMTLAQQLSNCCCENRLLVTQMGYEGQIRDMQNTAAITSSINTVNSGIERGFSSVAFETAKQTCDLQKSIESQSRIVTDAIKQVEDAHQQEKIATLTAQLTAANARAERAAELKPIMDELAHIRCAQPNTISVPYPTGTFVPNCGCQTGLGYGYGYGPFGATPGFWG